MFIGHAHIGSGSAGDLDAVVDLLEKENEAKRGSPDLYVRGYNQFGVEDARELRERASLRPVSGRRRVFVIAASSMTVEAQNALLKVFEEPPAHALFILLVPSPETLLQTLRSRAQKLEIAAVHIASIVDVVDFLKATPKKRLDLLKPLLEKGDDDKRDTGNIIRFLAELERSLEKRIEDPASRAGLDSIYMARRYINDKGALLKPLLEQAALLIP